MGAYYQASIDSFIDSDVRQIVGELATAHARDGYRTQFTTQTRAWADVIPSLQTTLRALVGRKPESRSWSLILEFPLYRLRKRLDGVLLAKASIVVLEFKVGAAAFSAGDERQVEEYALDLRDFHAGSKGQRLIPILLATMANRADFHLSEPSVRVWPVARTGLPQLDDILERIPLNHQPAIEVQEWIRSAYRPVPTIIEAATQIFAGNDVRSITMADASNLDQASTCLVEWIRNARTQGKRLLIFLTGVPGSGKTLAGLKAVHDAISTGADQAGDIVYLSGNTPLVTVLRESLALDNWQRSRGGATTLTLDEVRRGVRTRIQHINDFLKTYLEDDHGDCPHEHAIVFDEAQRAWDEEQGAKKFGRLASEPTLLLELMDRQPDWCACVCLVGGGQEINTGEEGVVGWGRALRQMSPERTRDWTVVAPADVIGGGASTAGLSIGQLPDGLQVIEENKLQLEVPIRSFRSPKVAEWVSHVLAGRAAEASATSRELGEYPILLTRSLAESKARLLESCRGERRCGLVASSGARRLRADGVGELLGATDGADIAHWYLKPRGDIRSSFALEVPANEYACQGLELDFVGLCWGGDFLWDAEEGAWNVRRLSGAAWDQVRDDQRRAYVVNRYRVLLTRAREGLILWVPVGDKNDSTRDPDSLDATAQFLMSCGVTLLA
jgi:hypothetical protein